MVKALRYLKGVVIMTNSKYGRLLYIATSVFLVLLGIAFIVCCAHLFFTGGDTPYSRERVGDYLLILLVPSIITILLVVGGFVYDTVTGAKNDASVGRTNLEILAGFAQRVDSEQLSDEAKQAVEKERKIRKIFAYASYAFSAVLAVGALLYVTLVAEFTVENLNADVIAALAVALPLLVGAVAIHIPRVYLAEASAKRELDLLKGEVKKGVKLGKTEPLTETNCEKNTVLIARIAILCIGALFVILGIFNGGMADVLAKAVKICTECIGLG